MSIYLIHQVRKSLAEKDMQKDSKGIMWPLDWELLNKNNKKFWRWNERKKGLNEIFNTFINECNMQIMHEDFICASSPSPKPKLINILDIIV